MQGRSPPKHRHDGTSPLPLGMDWSPPPKKWNGRDTVWPHDHRTGWSYCVTIPSWVVLPKSRGSDPVVFYRVQVGLQSPDGITTTRMVLRRFNDFLKLYAELKRAFPKKNLPAAPAKGLFRMKSRTLLDERKCSLEEWMTKLLSDIDLSRSFAVAAFLELEASARSSFEDPKRNTLEAEGSENSATASLQAHPDSSFSVLAGGSSITSDYGSDTPYETSDLGTPRFRRDDSSEIGLEDLALDEDLANPLEKLVKYGVSNIDEGLFMGQAILEQLEGFPRHKALDSQVNEVNGRNKENGIASKVSFLTGNDLELFSEPDHIKVTSHVRKNSADSVGSDVSSTRGSEMSNSGIPSLSGNGSLYFPGGESSSSVDNLGSSELKIPEDSQIMLPLDQRHKLHRVLFTMQRRLVTAKTDMEDLIGRLNQESAVKDYLTTKVKDLEAELESTRLKSKENLQQAILAEREMLTQMQWDMEEMRRKSFEMELKLKGQEDEKSTTEPTKESTSEDKHVILQELDATKEQLCNLQKKYEGLEARSKADVKVLVKEVKSLRNSQALLKEELTQSLEEKTRFEKLYQEEIDLKRSSKASWEKLLQECEALYRLLQQCKCNISFNLDNSKVSVDSSSPAETMKLLTDSDNQITLITTQASMLAQDASTVTENNDRDDIVKDDTRNLQIMLRRMLADIIADSAGSRKRLNSVLHLSIDSEHHLEKGEEAPS